MRLFALLLILTHSLLQYSTLPNKIRIRHIYNVMQEFGTSISRKKTALFKYHLCESNLNDTTHKK